MLILNAEKRDLKADTSKTRAEGKIPAVFYGPKEANTPIVMKEGEFMSVYHEAGESSIITLKIGTEEHDTLLKDVQYDALSGKVLHADFYVIEKGKKIEVSTPLVFVGESPAVKNLGGILIKVMHELPISALPKNLPHEIEVNIDSLVDFSSKIHTGDIKLPEGVELDIAAEETVVLVQEPREEKEPEPAPDLSTIEVEKKGKVEEEGAAPAAAAPAKEEAKK